MRHRVAHARRIAALIDGLGLGGVDVVGFGVPAAGSVIDDLEPVRVTVVVDEVVGRRFEQRLVRSDRVVSDDVASVLVRVVSGSGVNDPDDAADEVADVATRVADLIASRPHLEDDAGKPAGNGLVSAVVSSVDGPEVSRSEAGFAASCLLDIEVHSRC